MRSSAAKRFWPLAALLAIQALIITVAPSVAPTTTSSGLAAGAGGSQLGTQPLGGSPASGGTGVAGTTGTGVSGAGVGSSGTGPGGSSHGQGNAFVAGDTSHCVGGREFSTAIIWYAPPCTPGSIGVADPNNGGATAAGVSATQITIVDYVTDYGPEVNAIDQAQGVYFNYSDEQQLDAVMQKFINTHFVLYGRSIKFITYQGKCQSVPPDTTCLDAEMDSIVETYNPFAIMWIDNTVCSACYEEIAKDHVISVGGTGFSDQLSNELAPYFYSADESSSRVETAFAQWWCAQLSSVNDPTRVVNQAGTENPAQNFNGKTRVLGVISTNDPDNENTVSQVLGPALQKGCGDKIAHTYFYSQNINTAAQQTSAGIAAMDTTTNPATDVLCLCDNVAPQFLYQGEADANYWPENLIATDQFMDLDNAAQTYISGAGCPTSNGCEFDKAFGLSMIDAVPPPGQDPASRVWTMEGGQGSVGSVMGSTANADDFLTQFMMLASLIENAGPDLTPAIMQQRAPLMGSVGGGATEHELLGFAPGDWHWIQDNRIVYWDSTAPSSYNGQPGTYCQIESSRFNLGQFPVLSSGPPIPTPRPSKC
ncbi:MAG: hypothetical protein ACYDD4_07905 [Acidimicrobiales bacterium]